jgi:hypothetical protein
MKITVEKNTELKDKELKQLLGQHFLKKCFGEKTGRTPAKKLEIRIDHSAHEIYAGVGGISRDMNIATVTSDKKGERVSASYTLNDLIKIAAEDQGVPKTSVIPIVNSAEVEHERTPNGRGEKFVGLRIK